MKNTIIPEDAFDESRKRGTQSDGTDFSNNHVDAVWQKALDAMDNHPLLSTTCKTFSSKFRDGTHVLDDYGHVIARDEYGQESKHGWEIDHIHPVERKESYPSGPHSIDHVSNLRVLHWQSNERKGANDARIYELEYEYMILNKSA